MKENLKTARLVNFWIPIKLIDEFDNAWKNKYPSRNAAICDLMRHFIEKQKKNIHEPRHRPFLRGVKYISEELSKNNQSTRRTQMEVKQDECYELREKLSGYFGQRFHIVTARKAHPCTLCPEEIKPNEKCIRIFKPVIAEVKKVGWKSGRLGFVPERKRKGWIDLFYHIRCVENELFKRELQREQLKRRISEICPKCPHYKDGHCLRKIRNKLLVDFFCEKLKRS